MGRLGKEAEAKRKALEAQGLRECVHCGQTKPLNTFQRSNGYWSGKCRKCIYRIRANKRATIQDVEHKRAIRNAQRDRQAKEHALAYEELCNLIGELPTAEKRGRARELVGYFASYEPPWLREVRRRKAGKMSEAQLNGRPRNGQPRPVPFWIRELLCDDCEGKVTDRNVVRCSPRRHEFDQR